MPHGARSHRELVQVREAVDSADDHQTDGATTGLLRQEGESLGRGAGPPTVLGARERMLGTEVEVEPGACVEGARVVVDGDHLREVGH